MKIKSGLSVCIASIACATAMFFGACSERRSTPGPAAAALKPAVALPDDRNVTEGAIRFLESRVKADSEDHIAYNKLATYYLQLMRETGSITYLDLASKAAAASLAALPPERNTDGLTVKAQVDYAEHEFTGSRDNAKRMAELDPGKSYPFYILGDSLLELGDYDGAKAAYRQMERMTEPFEGVSTVAMNQRLARQAELYGETARAKELLQSALSEALSLQVPSRETVAYCHWQLGELAFSIGDYESAESNYRDSLTTFPNYFKALGSLGRIRAARGDIPGAIEFYERAVRVVPDPTFVAALGDLYKLSGREREAQAQYALVEKIGHLSALNGVLYNRALAWFRADHNTQVEEGYEYAAREYAVRKDIYGADALAWSALKAGRIDEAQKLSRESLRLGTHDAKLLYHAGEIAMAAGDKRSAIEYLGSALKLNPCFDPLQSIIAKQDLLKLNGSIQ
ncbi:MAG TPA: tetratricopeptide repeat protein [Blastocatellia bacterium]|nr:tetratricopeptide repeat protein [Blastocatellia bacterium]